jgi:hypothetical protein
MSLAAARVAITFHTTFGCRQTERGLCPFADAYELRSLVRGLAVRADS